MELKQVPIINRRQVSSSQENMECLKLDGLNLSEAGIYNDLNEESLAPFKTLRPEVISDVDLISRVKILRVPDFEMGLKGVAYLENYSHVIDGEDDEDCTRDFDLLGDWVDSPYFIPIVPWSSLQSASVFQNIGIGSQIAEEALVLSNELTKVRQPDFSGAGFHGTGFDDRV